MAAPMTMAAPMMTEVIAAPAITTMAAPVTMAAAPMMTEVIAAPMTTTMAAPVTMAAPMITEVVGSSAGGWGAYGSTMAAPLATTYGSLSATSGITGTCRHCGNHFMDDSNFCRKCGQPRY